MNIQTFEELINEIEIEFERFKRYKTPFVIIIFSIEFQSKEMQLNYLHKVIFDLKNFLDKIIRRIDVLGRNRNSILVILKNADLEKAQGFINRVFNAIDKFVKDSYKQTSKNVLVDIIINVSIIYFSDFLAEGYDNILVINNFEKNNFVQIVNNIDKFFETWELRFPISNEV